MALFKDIGLGVGKTLQSFGFVSKNRLWHFAIYPLIVSILLLVVFATALHSGVDALSSWLEGLLQVDVPEDGSWWDQIKNIGAQTAKYAAIITVYVASYYLYYKFQKYLLLILMSPVMALLSEKVDIKLTGHDFPFELPQLIRDIWRGALIALRNLSIELFIMVLVFAFNIAVGFLFPPLSLIVSPLAAIFLFVIGAYFAGFSILDYNNERQRLSVSQSVSRIRKHKGVAIGVGTVYMLLLFLPFLGPILATVICTTGATLAWHEKGLLHAPIIKPKVIQPETKISEV